VALNYHDDRDDDDDDDVVVDDDLDDDDDEVKYDYFFICNELKIYHHSTKQGINFF